MHHESARSGIFYAVLHPAGFYAEKLEGMCFWAKAILSQRFPGFPVSAQFTYTGVSHCAAILSRTAAICSLVGMVVTNRLSFPSFASFPVPRA